MGYTVLITGSTGMVGKGVLLECLDSPLVDRVKVLNRSSLNMDHPKLEEILLKDFGQMHTVAERFDGLDACFHCMGVSSLGMSEEDFSRLTFTVTKDLADAVHVLNPNAVFCYVSGTGTDESEKGRTMWARVKGRTENYVLNRGFKAAWMFRPGAIVPERGIRSRTNWYQWIYNITRPLFPLMKRMKGITTTTRIGHAMLHVVEHEAPSVHLENPAINDLAKQYVGV
jgi:nucleoside-diphosphate-sugar epimerase